MSSMVSVALTSEGGQDAAIASQSPMNAGSPWMMVFVLMILRSLPEDVYAK
jgi:hypothetical protein